MFSIQIKVPFRAAHRLMPPYEGKCNNVHGEGYITTVLIYCERLQEDDTLLDFKEVKGFVKQYVDRYFDHGFICRKDDPIGKLLENNGMKVTYFDHNPTAERIAENIFDATITWLNGRSGSVKDGGLDDDRTFNVIVSVQESFEDCIAAHSY